MAMNSSIAPGILQEILGKRSTTTTWKTYGLRNDNHDPSRNNDKRKDGRKRGSDGERLSNFYKTNRQKPYEKHTDRPLKNFEKPLKNLLN